ncbi:MAG TPA: hypothetical protein VLK88_17125 [Gemmatimonadales bacterium]|nr:hypothetical protein [Gemmatimonadales bacterium]
MDRPYYSQRAGRPPGLAVLSLQDLKRNFKAQFDQLNYQGYFQEYLGFECVDAGFVPGLVGTDLQTELLLTLRKSNLWPIHSTIDSWLEDDLFDMVEFLHDLSRSRQSAISMITVVAVGTVMSLTERKGGLNIARN